MNPREVHCLPVTWTHEVTQVQLPGSLTWWSDDPLTLKMTFIDPEGEKAWQVGRDLVSDAMRDGRAGIGDIRVTLGNRNDAVTRNFYPAIYVKLQSPFGTAELSTRLEPIIKFMSEICAVVPLGEEDLAVSDDDLTREFFSGGDFW